MIASENQAFRDLPNNEFYERGMLIDYLPGNLDVNSIHERIEALHQQSKAQ